MHLSIKYKAMKHKMILMIAVIILTSASLKAQILTPVKWSYAAKKTGANTTTLFLKAEIQDDWHIYSVNQGEDCGR